VLGAGRCWSGVRAADASPRGVVGWALLPENAHEVRGVLEAALVARSDEFADELDLARTLQEGFPGDPGIVVALLMNLVTLRKGEALFVPAGILHAYLDGLGVELMAASDNVLRGGLTPKHIDVPELLTVLEDRAGRPPVVSPRPVAPGISEYEVPVEDFSLVRADVAHGEDVEIEVTGPVIALATEGAVEISGTLGEVAIGLAPGDAVFATPDERALTFRGRGTVFAAAPGTSHPTVI
jgi:mannose-6-phosphate isomerase